MASRRVGATLACALLGAAAAQTPPTVEPGAAVRWTAPGAVACELGARRFDPIGDTCWFPVDLLQPPGPLTLAVVRGDGRETRAVQVADYPYDVQRLEIADQGYVDLSPENLARDRREKARIAELWGREGARRFELPLGTPLAAMPVGGRFGSRRIINGQPRSPHSGADYAADAGTPVLAVADGVVALAEEHFFSGKSVYIDHGLGLVTMSFHLSEILVEEGQAVKRGQTIGRVGATGRVTGPHLHFGARWQGARIDPGLLFGDGPARAPDLGAAR